MKETGLASGTLYPILARLVDRGWLKKDWDIGEDQSGPPRRIYTLTALGRAQLKDIADTNGPQPQMAKARTAE